MAIPSIFDIRSQRYTTPNITSATTTPKEPKNQETKWWVEATPKPNSSEPISVTVTIHVVGSNIDPSKYSVEYWLFDSEWHRHEHGFLNFTKIASNEVVAKYCIPSDRKYFLSLKLLEEGVPIGYAGVQNYKG